MSHINLRLLIISTVFVSGCTTASRVTSADTTEEHLRDVFILSILAREYLRNTGGEDFNLEKLISIDSSGRIAKNFERIERINRGGHIAIQYKFSGKRDYKVEFTEKEGQMVENWRVVEKKLMGDADGEIHFEFGERFYNFRKMIIRKPFGPKKATEFQQLHSLKVDDEIIIRSPSVSYAPEYAYPIVSGNYVERDGKIIHKAASRQGGC